MESDSEDEIQVAKRNFDKIRRGLSTEGFREGAEKGNEAAFQSGFDTGYAQGFETAFALGKFNGIVEALKMNADSLSLDLNELENCRLQETRRGLCSICPESTSCSCKAPKDITTLIQNQKQVTDRILQEQRTKCTPVFEKAGVINILKEQG